MKLFMTALLFLVMTVTTQPAHANDLDFSKAITIGSGPKTVVEFTDPDCPFCRMATKYLDSRTDITRHIFLYPLPRHPKAKDKARYILSQMNKGAAYHDVMAGKMDAVQKFDGITPKGIQLQEEHVAIVKKNKVKSTPNFIINGRLIVGFDQKKIEEALGK